MEAFLQFLHGVLNHFLFPSCVEHAVLGNFIKFGFCDSPVEVSGAPLFFQSHSCAKDPITDPVNCSLLMGICGITTLLHTICTNLE
jgi:hypothetical protein